MGFLGNGVDSGRAGVSETWGTGLASGVLVGRGLLEFRVSWPPIEQWVSASVVAQDM